MSPTEHVGLLYIENQRLLDEYRKLLALVQRAKDGEVRLEQIRVDVPMMTWAIEMTGPELQAAMSGETPPTE